MSRAITGGGAFARRVAVASAAVLLAGAISASAQGGPEPRPGGFHGGGQMVLPLMLKGANLTADQQAQVKQIIATHRAATASTFQQLRAAQNALVDKVVAAGTVQEADIQPQIDQINQLRAQLMQDGARLALEVRGVLTADQLARVSQLKDRMRELRSEMRQLWQSQPTQ